MNLTLVIVSGLPGTGKTTLSTELARRLYLPVLRIDDIVLAVPEAAGMDFWDRQIDILLNLAETQLRVGISVILDSVFMAYDRYAARDIAAAHNAAFRPIYSFVSDEAIWQARVEARFDALSNPDTATWSGILEQQKGFLAWPENTALFVDAIQPLEENIHRAVEFVSSPGVDLAPLPGVVSKKGQYHLAY